mgnify:CR=1 FL=1
MQDIVCLALVRNVRLVLLTGPNAGKVAFDLSPVSAPELVNGHTGHLTDNIPQGMLHRGTLDEVRTQMAFQWL